MDSFSSPAIAELYDQAKGFCHPDYPFLDSAYSPGGFYPFTDFTMNVAEWMCIGNHAAIRELWSFLTYNGDAERYLLEKCLRVNVIPDLEFDSSTALETKAIYMLMSRQSLYDTSSEAVGMIGSRLLASRLASISWIPPRDCRELLHKGASIEAIVPEGAKIRARRIEQADEALLELLRPVPEPVRIAGQWLLQIPPITRLVIADYFTRPWAQGRLRPELYYTERKYGCSVPWNLHFIKSINCFEPPSDDSFIPNSITKHHLQEALSLHGVVFKKSFKREDLIKLGLQQRGLIASVIQQYAPEYQKPRTEWIEALRGWTERLHRLECVAAAILKALGMQAIRAK